MRTALVLAGGGVAGIAWELGVLRGLADLDPALADRVIAADVIVGTSAGSSVAAQITSGTPLDRLYEAQLGGPSAEIAVEVDLEQMLQQWAEAMRGASGPAEMRRRLGTLALATETVDEPTRLAAIRARLPRAEWPERPIVLPAVDAETGALVAFTRESGVELVAAVAASCAVPGVWPPVTINGRRFVDGGVRSGTNADLAKGADRVLVVAPALPGAPQGPGDLDAELAALGPAEALVIWADEASVAAFGNNPLSPETRGPAARAGRTVGRDRAPAVAEFWR
jgi:NTE family protein